MTLALGCDLFCWMIGLLNSVVVEFILMLWFVIIVYVCIYFIIWLLIICGVYYALAL